MRTRLLDAAGLALVLVATTAAPATAKGVPRGLRLCGETSCVAITDKSVAKALSLFYYGGPKPFETAAPRVGAPYFLLKFGNDYLTGFAATSQLDRFRSRGVNMDRFNLEDWYRVPPQAALGLRKLAAKLRPLRVTESTIGPTRYG